MKKIRVIFCFAMFIALSVIITTFYLITSEPEKPKTLAGEIAKNIREHPSDWIYIDGNNFNRGHSVTAYDSQIISATSFSEMDTLINRKCNIRIDFDYYSAIVVYPDSFLLNKEEADTIIGAFRNAIYIPHEIARADSVDNIRKKKEQEMLNKFCK